MTDQQVIPTAKIEGIVVQGEGQDGELDDETAALLARVFPPEPEPDPDQSLDYAGDWPPGEAPAATAPKPKPGKAH